MSQSYGAACLATCTLGCFDIQWCLARQLPHMTVFSLDIDFFAITIVIRKTVIPIGEFRWTMFGPCFANQFSLDDDFDSSVRARKTGVFGT